MLLECLVLQGMAQVDTVYMRGRFDESSLKLRWSCANLDVLRQGFLSGYRLELFEMTNNQEVLLETRLVRTNPIEAQEYLLNQTDSAAFSVSQEIATQSNFFSDPEERRWKFLSLLFGLQDNFSLTKSLAMGTEFSGLDLVKRYQIKININESGGRSDLFFENLEISYPHKDSLPKPEPLEAICRNNRVILTGLMAASADYYSSFRIERDTFVGNNYVSVNDVPLIVNYAERFPQIYLIDTIIESRPTRYRVQGKDIWGNWGSYSDTIFVDPCHIQLLPPQPFQSYEVGDRGAVEMWWSIPDSLQSLIEGFEIFRSSNKFSGYQKISSLLVADQYAYRDDKPLAINHYFVEAIYQGGIRRRSLSDLTALIDTEPPPVPNNVSIDFDTSNFVATITWDQITIMDFSGYRILYSTTKHGQKFLLYNLELEETIYRDSINKNILQEDRYYWITSRDVSGNESFFSDPVFISLPDRFPPTPARITNVRSDFDYVEIRWIGSPSRDVKTYHLQKKFIKDIDWQNVIILDTGQENTYMDTSLIAGDTALYQILVEDSSGLLSRSNIRSAIGLADTYLPDIEFFEVVNNDTAILIRFDYPESIGVKYFRLMGGTSPDQMKTVDYLIPSQGLNRVGIIKQGNPKPFVLFQYLMSPPINGPYYLRLSSIGNDGRLSRFTEVRQL